MKSQTDKDRAFIKKIIRVAKIISGNTGITTISWIISVLLFIVILLLLGTPCRAQNYITIENPFENAALAEGNDLINEMVSNEMEEQSNTSSLMLSMNTELDMIEKWKNRQNRYLMEVDGLASSLKAASNIYITGVRIFMTLTQLKKAIKNNPQGIVATVSMNNLYQETFVELCTVYTLINGALAKGGNTNMLNAKERCQLFYELEERLESFSTKLNQLYMSIRHYTLGDVWYHTTAGMYSQSRKHEVEICAKRALNGWIRTGKETWNYR